MLKDISIIIALINCFLTLSLAALYKGFEMGMSETIGFRITDNIYEQFVSYYVYIFIFSIIFLIGKLIKKGTVSKIVCLISLILMIFPYWILYSQKNYLLENPDIDARIFQQTMLFDLISFSILLVLLIYQLINTLHYLFYKSRKIT